MGCGLSSKKLIVVTGSTGQQGGAVINAILKYHNDQFNIRAIVRNLEKAQAKIPQGVEVVQGDFNDVESLKKAFAGAYGVFCVTNFWETMDAEQEKKHANNLAVACEANKIQHVVWSTLENTRDKLKHKVPIIKDNYYVPHFDAKFDANEFFKNLPTTFLHTSFYYENFINMPMIQKSDAGLTIALNMGDAVLPMVAVEDIGKAAANIFKKPELKGKNAYIASDILTCNEIATLFSKHLGAPCAYYKMDDESYRKLPFPGAMELGNMFTYYREDVQEFAGNRKTSSKALVSNLISFDAWLSQHKDKIKY